MCPPRAAVELPAGAGPVHRDPHRCQILRVLGGVASGVAAIRRARIAAPRAGDAERGHFHGDLRCRIGRIRRVAAPLAGAAKLTCPALTIRLSALVGLIILAPSLIGQIGVAIPVIVLSFGIRVLELFVAFLQAYIFMFLTTLFIASAVAPEH